MSISARIKEERERLGFTQTQFAALAEASKKTQIRWEQEDGTSPDAEAMAKWIAVGLDALYVLTGERVGNASAPTHSNRATPHDLPPDEQMLLDAYRALATTKKKQLLSSLLIGEVGKKPAKAGGGVVVTGSRNKTAGRDYHE